MLIPRPPSIVPRNTISGRTCPSLPLLLHFCPLYILRLYKGLLCSFCSQLLFSK
nr:MAG TPA: hypothetical protein [Inoviridae sp.]